LEKVDQSKAFEKISLYGKCRLKMVFEPDDPCSTIPLKAGRGFWMASSIPVKGETGKACSD